jgi:hypothetical protein
LIEGYIINIRIVLIVSAYFTRRDEFLHGINIFKKNVNNIEVWDLSKILMPESIDILMLSNGEFNPSYIRRFNSFHDVVNRIETIEKETTFILNILYLYNTIPIFRAISKFGLQYCCVGNYTIGTSPTQTNKLPFFTKNFLNKKYLKHIIFKLYRIGLKIPIHYYGINYAKVFFIMGGSKANTVSPLINNKTQKVWIHAFDYDLYLSLKKKINNNNYIVFIDQYLPFHPDTLVSPIPNIIEPIKYYSDLRNYFDHIELITTQKVIIAAHPKADYVGNEKLFGFRKIVHGFNSAELINEASLVLMHSSRTINLVVLFNKPVQFITSNLLNKTKIGAQISAIASYFNQEPININSLNNDLLIDKVNLKKYSAYISEYIKKPFTKEIPFWKQLIDFIKLDIYQS